MHILNNNVGFVNRLVVTKQTSQTLKHRCIAVPVVELLTG